MEESKKIVAGTKLSKEEAEQTLIDLIAKFNEEVEFNGEILFPDNEEDLPPLKEVVEFLDDESDLLRDVSADEVKKIEK